eukprot:CAMPEP_0168718206 /NCGR_PEP_ID=MMETSP0724-20121128/395_1 /TAXON_ID=265536 /ORGANISM="Amphiprora sp., Strain CCMP467" /LENGTH=238 /DNA_ID=CAMNT_0008764705 /DNA_START=20 /DNA_END=736 /DNA_ORIENTATION=+
MIERKSFFQDFKPEPVKIRELLALEEMMKDVHHLELVLQYIKNSINLSRKVSSAVDTHRGSHEKFQAGLYDIVDFWAEYESGPKTLATRVADEFEAKYGDDEAYTTLYRDKLKEAYGQIQEKYANDPPMQLQLRKEVDVAYKFHHKSKLSDLRRMLDENEKTYRRNSVENCVGRIRTKLQAHRKMVQTKKGGPKQGDIEKGEDLVAQACSVVEILADVCRDEDAKAALVDLQKMVDEL